MSFDYDRDFHNLLTNSGDHVQNEQRYLLRPDDILNFTNNEQYQNSRIQQEEYIDYLSEDYNHQSSEDDDSDIFSDDDDEVDDNEEDNNSVDNVCRRQYKEILRKESIINKKDEKATRLIEIIRGKNKEIEDLKKNNLENKRLIWKLYREIHTYKKINNSI